MTYIEEIRIVRFAGIRDRVISLSCGLNLIIGGNESGKSSTEAFLNYIFYGFADKAERTRWIPLDGGACEGSCTVSCDGQRFRVERRTVPSGAERMNVIDLASHAPIPEIAVPGEHFFGVPRDIFVGAAQVRQSDVATLDSRMGEAVDNMLFSADEHINIPKALKKLDDARAELWYKNRKGGRICENERRLEELESRFAAASEKQAGIIDTEGRLIDTRAQKEGAEKKLTELAAQIRTGELLQYRNKRAEVEDWKRQRAGSRSEVEKILAEFPEEEGRVRPDRSFLDRVRSERSRLNGLEKEQRAVDDRLRAIMNGKGRDAAEAKFPDLARDVGGIRKVGEHVTSLGTAREKQGKRSLLLLIAAAVFLVAALILFFALPGKPVFPILALVLCAACLVFAVICRVKAIKAKKEEKNFISSFGAVDRDELLRWMDRVAQPDHKTALTAAEQLRIDRSELFAAADEHREILDGLCRSVGCASPEEAEKKVGDYLDRLNAAGNEFNRLDTMITTTETMLRDDAERFENAEPEVALPPDFDLKEARRADDFEKKRLAALTDRLHSLEIRRTELRATAEPTASLSDRIIETKRRLEKDRESFAAYELARDTLAGASDDLRKLISPRLSAAAGENMKYFSGGRYEELGVSGDFGLSFPAGTENGGTMSADSVYMSQATRDGAYLSLRIALLDLLCQNTDKRPPFLFDEALVFFDEKRLSEALKLLASLAPKVQTILFSSSEREAILLEEGAGTVCRL